ncbi:MAG: ABC transporter permease [Ferruginibacter sp.]|nr:ABC transporter permease [Ferruginibacter sp.]
MLKNYFKIAWRNLKRHKSYAAINIVGLSLGIACSILIFVLVNHHLSFDNFHSKKDRVYRVTTEWHDGEIGRSGAVPSPVGKAVRTELTFSEKAARVIDYRGTLVSIPDEKNTKKFQEEDGVVYAEPEFFDILDFPLAKGNKKDILRSPNTAIITEKMSKKYFGSTDGMGKVFRINNSINFTVTGILKDIPTNTDRPHEIYLSYENLKDHNRWLAGDSSWGGVYSGCQLFVLLKPSATVAQANTALQTLVKKNYSGRDLNIWKFKLQPLSDIHFNPELGGYADRKYLWALFFIGAFLVITACVNFINLATAQALNRAKEIGIRKVLGSLKGQLFWQFITETALITIFAVLLAYLFAEIGLPFLNDLFETQIRLQLFSDWRLPVFLLATSVVVVFLSGSYPGLILARFQPVEALKSRLSQKHIGGFSLRRVLVITQFAISQMLIIGTIVVASQMHYSKTSDLGFVKDGIVTIPVPSQDKSKLNTFTTRLASIPGVQSTTLCFQPPASNSNNTTDIKFENRAESERWNVNTKTADEHYLETFGLKLVAGRNFFPSDTIREWVVNETFAKKLKVGSPAELIGKSATISGITAPIVGVIKDFYNYSFHSEISAVVVFPGLDNYGTCALRVNMNNSKATMASVEKVWNETFTDYIYSQQFLDERVAEFYELDNIMLSLIKFFACIAIFIGCLGLYGLVSFMAVRKTKEIGVRKVLGARMQSILWMFGKEFSTLLIIAFAIAAPLAWWAMHKYLQDYTYKINIGIWIFLASIGCTFLIALLTVGYRSVRASLANPVTSLRTE